jgi:hypothetical protein
MAARPAVERRKGKRNGQYRHGGFTAEAIDERRRLALLLRNSRDFLSSLQ